MSEKCPYCGKLFENTKALGSHIHYNHETQSWASLRQKRSENEKGQFKQLLDSCLTDRGLPKPRQMDNVLKELIAQNKVVVEKNHYRLTYSGFTKSIVPNRGKFLRDNQRMEHLIQLTKQRGGS